MNFSDESIKLGVHSGSGVVEWMSYEEKAIY